MKTKLLVLLLALQAAWVIGTVAVQETRLRHGQVVLLETVPVDPRDLLRGDYVILSYKISRLDAGLFVGGWTNAVPDGTPVYVRLDKHGPFHEAIAASFTPLEPEANRPVLRGRVSRNWGSTPNELRDSLRIDYGLERFYVREGSGEPRGKLTVAAAVPVSGQAIIKQVYVDGKPYAEAMREGR
jgi:uncharacterized membrane-anchored protein